MYLTEKKIYIFTSLNRTHNLRTVYIPVRIVCGAADPIAATKFLKVHLNASIVSSVSRTPANMILWKWLLTPMYRPNGKLYKFVR
jgi:hypothetical protein